MSPRAVAFGSICRGQERLQIYANRVFQLCLKCFFLIGDLCVLVCEVLVGGVKSEGSVRAIVNILNVCEKW